MIICKGCQKKINLEHPLNLILQDYIVTNKPYMEFVLMLNKIEECLIALQLVFVQSFQLHGHWQYGMHGSIVNVLTKLNLIQNFLPQMPYDIWSIFILKENKIGI